MNLFVKFDAPTCDVNRVICDSAYVIYITNYSLQQLEKMSKLDHNYDIRTSNFFLELVNFRQWLN